MVLKESELFSYLKEFYYPDLEFSEDKYAKNDCYSKQHQVYMELKSRNTHYDELIIEQIKWEALVTEARYFDYTPMYVNATPEGIWAFDLSKIKEIKWEDKWLPAKTEFPSGGNKTKIVGYLHIQDGVKL